MGRTIWFGAIVFFSIVSSLHLSSSAAQLTKRHSICSTLLASKLFWAKFKASEHKMPVGRRTVDFAYCRWPENRPPIDAVSSGGFFDLVVFPTFVSLYICRWSNEIDSTSGGGSKSNDALSIDPNSVSTTGILHWTGFPLLYKQIAYCLTTNSTVRQGGGSKSNDALSSRGIFD